MKPELVVPDLLAAMTADALFAGKPERCAAPGATRPLVQARAPSERPSEASGATPDAGR